MNYFNIKFRKGNALACQTVGRVSKINSPLKQVVMRLGIQMSTSELKTQHQRKQYYHKAFTYSFITSMFSYGQDGDNYPSNRLGYAIDLIL